MGVKSTVELTRAEAEERWINFALRLQRWGLEAFVKTCSTTELEERLEKLNDNAHGGEGFENYRITDPCG